MEWKYEVEENGYYWLHRDGKIELVEVTGINSDYYDDPYIFRHGIGTSMPYSWAISEFYKFYGPIMPPDPPTNT
jgi:hypothetical protein